MYSLKVSNLCLVILTSIRYNFINKIKPLRSTKTMDETERTIINLINSSTDPSAALEIAIELALDFLRSLGASQCTMSETAQATA